LNGAIASKSPSQEQAHPRALNLRTPPSCGGGFFGSDEFLEAVRLDGGAEEGWAASTDPAANDCAAAQHLERSGAIGGAAPPPTPSADPTPKDAAGKIAMLLAVE